MPSPIVQMSRLWTTTLPTLETFVRASVTDHHDGDDIIQATGEYIASNFAKYEPGTSFTGWAITVAKYRILELHRAKAKGRAVLSIDAIDAIAVAAEQDADGQSERSVAMAQCVAKLKTPHRTLLEMRYFQGVQAKTIAERLGKTPNWVSVSLLRIRESLRACIERRLRAGGAGGVDSGKGGR